jgi:hypothetical protein
MEGLQNELTGKTGEVINTVSDAATKATEGLSDGTKEAGNVALTYLKESWLILLIIGAMFLLVLVVFYIFYLIKKSKLKNVVLHSDMIVLDNRNVVPHIVSADDMSSLTMNGQEFSYSTWIFLANNYDATSDHKLIMQRGNTSTVAGMISPNTSPIIAMDSKTNKMYIAVSTSAVTNPLTFEKVFEKDAATNRFTSGFLVTYIDYVPLQRWVNVILVVREMNMYVYIDGDVYSVASASEVRTNSDRPMIRGTSGDLAIGEKRNTTHGYLSLTQFFNYGLTQKEVRSIYANGPSRNSWLAIFGLGSYGVRSPVYKIA